MATGSARHRSHLPQLDGGLFLTDGGLETTLIFREGLDLPLFAAFGLLGDEAGRDALRRYYAPYLALAAEHGTGFVLDTPTWRASPRWAAELGRSVAELDDLNRRAVGLMEEIRDAADAVSPIVISGCVGPQGDGYSPAEVLTAEQAADYHSTQIGTFASTAADMVSAMTMTHVEEAIGITRACMDAGIPVTISFTLETDGRLPSGQGLPEAIGQVDRETDGEPGYFMINCAHPTHFEAILDGGAWSERVLGLRANASRLSHAELDEAEDLDDGDPADLGARYAALHPRLPALNVLGGCCGTDERHVREIAAAWS